MSNFQTLVFFGENFFFVNAKYFEIYPFTPQHCRLDGGGGIGREVGGIRRGLGGRGFREGGKESFFQ